MTLPDGAPGWLVTGYEEGRAVLADPRLSSRRRRLRTGGAPADDAPVPPPQFGVRRTAVQDLELAGHRIPAGSTVVACLPSANRDTGRFPGDPDRLDVHRPSSPHLAFGHGIHQCLGQQLARVELTAALSALVDRFPTLRPAVPVEQVPMRDDMLIYGVHALPVTW
ncbi:cytochrome P450 [Streptomyces auratus]